MTEKEPQSKPTAEELKRIQEHQAMGKRIAEAMAENLNRNVIAEEKKKK